jgi:hypothetical protein
MLKDITDEVREAALEDTNKFLYKFLEHEDLVVKELQSFEGLQTELYLHQKAGELNLIKYAAIFSDFISLYTGNSSTAESHMTYFDEGSPYHYDRQITIPASLRTEIHESSHILPGYFHNNSFDLHKAAKQFEPLISQSKAMLRPVRALWVDTNHIVDKKEGVIYYAQGNTDTRHWIVRDTFSKESLPIDNYLSSSKSKVLFELVLPYFKNTSLENLTKVLVDESDNLSPLRKELKNMVVNFDENSKTLKEVQQDIIRPQLDIINRQFKYYSNKRKINSLGGIGMFSLSLIKLFVPHLMISELINTIVSGSSLSSIFVSELNHQANMNTLRDNPYFLLWKIETLK